MVHADRLRASRKNLRQLFHRYCSSDFARRRLKGASLVGQLAGSPIHYTLRPTGICGDGFLMIGEASLLTHPMTGEGISQAFRSSAVAARVLEEARDAKEITREVFRPYAQEIQELFRRNFWKARFLKRWIDRPSCMIASVALTRLLPDLKSWAESRLNRIVL